MTEAIQWLDENYPKEERKGITKLLIDGKDLKANYLDLSDFVELEVLNISRNNNLIEVNLRGCKKIREIYANRIDQSSASSYAVVLPGVTVIVFLGFNYHLENHTTGDAYSKRHFFSTEENYRCEFCIFARPIDKNEFCALENERYRKEFFDIVKNSKEFQKEFNWLIEKTELRDKLETLKKFFHEINPTLNYECQEIVQFLENQEKKIQARNLLKDEFKIQEQQIEEFKNQLMELNELMLYHSPYDFSNLKSEIKNLKIQDLTIQIPLKKEELEGLTNIAKSKLNEAEEYLLEKLFKKHKKIMQSNDDLEKLKEIKEILNKRLTNEETQTLLTKQKQVLELENHLSSLQ